MKHLITLLFISTLFSCEKEVINDTDDSQDHVVITINLTTPAENSSFEPSDVVSIAGSINSNQTIHGYSVELINASNNDSVLFANNVHSHDATLNFNYSWTNNLTLNSNVLVRITALGDHEGLISEVLNRNIQCNGL